SAAILALVQADAIDQVREALLAGARGFVTKPLRGDELRTTLRQVLARTPGKNGVGPAAQTTNGRVIVFCAPKGGTGRTTLAINTSIRLQTISRKEVVLMDADYASPAVDVALNLPSRRTVVDLLPRLSRLDDDLISGVLVRHASEIRVLLAPPPADLSSPMSLPQVQQVLVGLKRLFPWVVVDLGLPLDETAFAFLDSADRIVISVLPEMVGLRNTRLMLDQLQERGYPDEKVWLVLNRATMVGGVPLGDIERRLRVTVKYSIPDDQPLATHSINRGVPLVMSHERSAVARAVQQFAQRLVESLSDDLPRHGMKAEQHSERLSGWIGRFRRPIRSAET
ncbi:MAG TPA: hypothetical protein DEP84_25420, partial [Chloroflexi bacterium]|nr:hypothetical protein [Chloroflexota bacterium]